MITKGELIAALQALPVSDDTEVMVKRGDWGPCQASPWQVQVALVQVQGAQMNWEVAFPELEPEEGEVRKEVVIL